MTIAFIHGAGCLPHVFAAQLAAFPDAIAVNVPGHGVPGAPASIETFADALAEELHSRDARNVVLAGSSMGGAIALELALRGSDRIAAVILLGSAARLRVAPSIFEAIDADFSAAAAMLATSFYARPSSDRVQASIDMMLAVGAAQTRRDFEACDAFDARERLGELHMPLLALTGEKDALTPPKLAESLVGRVPGATARIVPDAGHLLFVERPDETNDAIRSFVTTIA